MEKNFIDESLILDLLSENSDPDTGTITDIINKALKLKGLALHEIAALLNIRKKSHLELLFKAATKIKNSIYGNRLVVFAPLYISNYCSNNCLYCAFRNANRDIKRKVLTMEEIEEETMMILDQGHKRILMLMGEDDAESSLDFFIRAIAGVYSVRNSRNSSIRRINVEIAPLSDPEFQQLRKAKIGTYTVFQETYHKSTYEAVHSSGKKTDFDYRLLVMDRALRNGINDVGIGALFGLYDYRFEVMGLVSHALHLEEKYGTGPHTISVPRIEPALNAPVSQNIPHPVSDKDFMKIVAALRCSVPYTGIILSTRENAVLRNKVFNLGVSQISAGSRTNPGGYKEAPSDSSGIGQFSLNDARTCGEVLRSLVKQKHIPSFCTGCYRLGRTGKDFMDLAKPGLIKKHCLPNAILTFQEYLEDYADKSAKVSGEKLIAQQLTEIPDIKTRNRTVESLKRIKAGERDIYF